MLSVSDKLETRKPFQREELFSATDGNETRRVAKWIQDRISHHRHGDMSSENVMLTPAGAEYLLNNHNRNNRAVRTNRVREFAKIITDGRWQLTSQGISFDREGRLNNGQHRLHGIVESGRSVQIRVTWGEEPAAFSVLDTGTARGGQDVLHILGYKYTTILAAAARVLSVIEGGPATVSNDDVIEIVTKHQGLADVAPIASSIANKFRVSSAAICSALYYIQRDTRHGKDLHAFIMGVTEGAMLPKYSPMLALRDGLANKKFDAGIRHTGVPRAIAICACFIKAWNAYVDRQQVKLLRFTANETFPEAK